MLGRIVTTAGEPSRARPRHQRLPRGGPRLPRRGGHGGPGARALGRDPRAATRTISSALTAPLDTLRTAQARRDRATSAPRRGGCATWPCGWKTRARGRRRAGRHLDSSRSRSAPPTLLRSMLLIAPVILAAAAAGRLLARRDEPPAGARASWTRWRPSATAGASTGGSPCRISGDEMARLALTVNGMLARLEQSFASLHRFTADASHELKTPLMVLRAGVERALVHPGVPRGDPPVAGRDAGADQSDDGDGGEPADAGAGRRGPGAARGGGVRPAGRGRRRGGDGGDAGRERRGSP